MKRFFMLIALVTLLLGSTPFSTFAKSNTLVVDDDFGLPGACAGAQFRTIQDALKEAKSGTTINICNGSYTGGLTITKKGINLVSTPAGVAHIVGGSVNGLSNILVQADNVRIEGLDISFSGVPITVRGNNVQVLNNLLRDNQFEAIDFFKSKNGTIRGNTLFRNGVSSINTGGIFVSSSSGMVIEKNTVKDSKSLGIILRDTKNSRIALNTVTGGTGVGIELCNGSKKNVVEQNTVTGNKRAGILVDEPKSSFCDEGSAPSVDNTFKDNFVIENGLVDVIDITKGKKTAGTANTWITNSCIIGNPSSLCVGRV